MTHAVDAFAQHLTAQGYRASTVRTYAEAMRGLHTHGPSLALHHGWASGARRFLDWPGHTNDDGLADAARAYVSRVDAAKRVITSRVGPRRAAQAATKRDARSIGDDAFTRLADLTWAESSVPAAVMSVLYATGLRVGDVLAVDRRALTEGRAHGNIRLTAKGGDERLLAWAGAPEEWARLTMAFAGQPATLHTVADLVTGHPAASTLAKNAAYQRVDRTLKRLAEDAGVPGQVHLHRLRRTVAVRALRSTQDITLVQQMLGHRNIATTAHYVNEARPEALAGIQRNINPRNRP